MMLLPILLSMAAQVADMSLPPGKGVQRSMRLMEQGQPVRVMFYGQSITAGNPWTKEVEADLRARFPKAKFEFRDMAIAGFAANLLKRCAERDALEFYPDLVILHDYGGEPDKEELIRILRTATTAEVLLQSDHITGVKTGEAEHDRGIFWHDQHATWLRAVAEKYGCGYVDIRAGWSRAMAEQNQPFTNFVVDDHTHLNPAGNALMANLVKPYLVRDKSFDRPDPVSTKEVAGGEIQFEGNRVDVRSASGSPAEIMVDGKRPSDHSELYPPSRTSNAFAAWFPALSKVTASPLPAQDAVKITLKEFSPELKSFKFEVEGGEGSGSSDRRFVSTSGQIVIEPQDWNMAYGYAVSKKMPPEGFQVEWRYIENFQDFVEGKDWITVAQGLKNGPHSLKIKGGRGDRYQIRIYKPSF